MFFNGIAYFFEQIYSQLNTTEADYSPYGLFSQPPCCTFSKCELRSCFRLDLKSAPLYPKIKRSKFFVLCKIDAITHKEQTFGSLKRRLPTLLYMSLLLM